MKEKYDIKLHGDLGREVLQEMVQSIEENRNGIRDQLVTESHNQKPRVIMPSSIDQIEIITAGKVPDLKELREYPEKPKPKARSTGKYSIAPKWIQRLQERRKEKKKEMAIES